MWQESSGAFGSFPRVAGLPFGFHPALCGSPAHGRLFRLPANSFTSLLLPNFDAAVARWMNPVQLVEMVFMLRPDHASNTDAHTGFEMLACIRSKNWRMTFARRGDCRRAAAR